MPKPISLKRKIYNEKRLKTMEEKYGNSCIFFKYKINWPSKENLEQLLKEKSCCQIAKELKVSDSAVRKQAKKQGINIKEISRWSKKHGSGLGGT